MSKLDRYNSYNIKLACTNESYYHKDDVSYKLKLADEAISELQAEHKKQLKESIHTFKIEYCHKCKRAFIMPKEFTGTILCEDCDPFMQDEKEIKPIELISLDKIKKSGFTDSQVIIILMQKVNELIDSNNELKKQIAELKRD